MSQKGSVFQKGGGGTNFEQHVQTAFLTTLIIRGNAPCLPANEIIEVSYQNTSKGYETDDLMVIAKSVLGHHRLLIQIKHDISFTIGNAEFLDVLKAFWKDYNNTAIFDKTKDKLIVIKNGLTRNERNHLKSLFNWAHRHASGHDFELEVNRIKGRKEILDMFRDCLKNLNDDVALTMEELWGFLKCLDVLEYDFLNVGSVAKTYFLNIIKITKSIGSTRNESEIWDTILGFSSELNKDGGSVTINSIQNEVLYKDFSVENLNPHYKAVAKLRDDSKAILNPIKNTVGKVHINRRLIKELLNESITSFPITILTGKPGVGKSSLIKELFEEQFPNSSFFVFRADQFNKPHISNVFSSLGINEPIQDIFSCVSLIPDKIIFIDSLEKILEADPECSFQQLLELLSEFKDIRVVASTRKYAIDLIVNKFGLNQSEFKVIDLPPLTDDELDIISNEHPELGIFLKNEKIKALLRSPKYLDFAIKALGKSNDSYGDITLLDFKTKLWDLLVVDSTNIKVGLPIKRENAFMEIAVKRAREMKLFTQPVNSDPEAIMELEKDEIVFQKSGERRYSPAHDILEDWALVRHVSSIYEDNPNPSELFAKLGNEPAIRRAWRLWIEDYLIENGEKVNNLVKMSLKDETIEKYWADELLVAIFKSEYSGSFFEYFGGELCKNKAILLQRCLHIIKTCCKENNFYNNVPILLPYGSGWEEILKYIKKNITLLDIIRPEIMDFLYDWNRKLSFQRSEVSDEELICLKEITLFYIYQIEAGQEFWEKSKMSKARKDLISTLFNLAIKSKQEIKELIGRAFAKQGRKKSWRLDFFYNDVIEKCLAGYDNHELIKEIPEIIVEAAWKKWKFLPANKNPPEGISALIDMKWDKSECWGIKDNSFFPSGVYQTPFYHFLWYHPMTALRFIIEFINYSVDFYAKADCEYKHQLTLIEFEADENVSLTLIGSPELWMAYRGLSNTHYLLESLLMSLEEFLLKTADKGTEDSKKRIKVFFDYILQNSNNVAPIGVLASVSMAYPKEVEEGMLKIISVKEFYNWDIARSLNEVQATAINDDMVPFAQEERRKSNQLPHRRKHRRGLADFILDYQFQIGILNEYIYDILEKFKSDVGSGDIIWKKLITEIDRRSFKLGDYSEEIKGFPVAPTYDSEVTEFIDSNKEDYERKIKLMNLSGHVDKAFKGEKLIDFSVWQVYHEEYAKGLEFSSIYDRPVTLAVLGIRDFWPSLNEKQREWCVEKIISTIVCILRESFNKWGQEVDYNILEKELALSSFHLLFKTANNEMDKEEIVSLMIYVFTAPFADYEIDNITKYFRDSLIKEYPCEGKKIWQSIIIYSQFRKTNPFFYDDHDAARLDAARNKEWELIKQLSGPMEVNLNFSEIDFDSHSSYILVRAVQMIPYSNLDMEYWGFVKRFVNLLVEDLQREVDFDDFRRRTGRHLNHKETNTLGRYLSEILIFSKENFCQELIDLLIDATHASNIEEREDLGRFIGNVFEYVVLKNYDLQDKDEVLLKHFWKVWEYFFKKVKKEKADFLVPELLFNVKFLSYDSKGRPNEQQWKCLDYEQGLYKQIVLEYSNYNITQYMLNFLSTVGEKKFLPEALTWLVQIYRNKEEFAVTLKSRPAERLAKQIFYNFMPLVKSNKILMDDYIWILNKMVDFGSSEAYLFRENVITYKINA